MALSWAVVTCRPWRQRRDANSFTCSTKQVPGAKSGSVQQDAEFMSEAKEGRGTEPYSDPPRQHWPLPALRGTGEGTKAIAN